MLNLIRFKYFVQLVIVSCAFALSFSVSAKEYRVDNPKQFKKAVKKLRPGDELIMRNGVWRDSELVFTGEGSAEKPITLRAEDKGKVILSGLSNLRLAGKHLVVSGLVFKDGYTPTNEVISFRRNKNELAHHSRVTEVVIDDYNNPNRFETDIWVAMYGTHNRFDHNYLANKRNKGVTMAVRLNTPESRENYHRIEYNYFGPRPILGANGGETLRIGTSHYSEFDSHTLVANNYFYHCDGELEIVSNKSGANIFRGNVFFESRGTLTLRHGDGVLVEDNVFLGNGKDHTGGIRVINRRQTVRNNYLQGLKGRRFGGALIVMNGVPNSPKNRYHQVEGAVIENNTVVDSENIEIGTGNDSERSAAPKSSQFNNNLLVSTNDTVNFTIVDENQALTFDNNVTNRQAIKDNLPGATLSEVDMKQESNGLLYPTQAFKNVGVKSNLKVVKLSDVGPAWYAKNLQKSDVTVKTVEPGIDTIAAALASLDNLPKRVYELRLKPGNYYENKMLFINKNIKIKADLKRRAQLQFTRSTLFVIEDGGQLEIDGLVIEGSEAPDMSGNSVIRTSTKGMIDNYRLKISNSTFRKLNTNHSFNVLTVSKNTFADAIDIENSYFSDISGSILHLREELADLGIYNAEYVRINNSDFKDIGGLIVDIYRGGTDESTFGPILEQRESKFKNVGWHKKNVSKSAFRLHGVQHASIARNNFNNSQPIQVFMTVGKPFTIIQENTFFKTLLPQLTNLSDAAANVKLSDNVQLKQAKLSKDLVE